MIGTGLTRLAVINLTPGKSTTLFQNPTAGERTPGSAPESVPFLFNSSRLVNYPMMD